MAKYFRGGNALVFLLNFIVGVLLLLAYTAPYVPPSKVAFISVLGLLMPILLAANVIFVIYWLINLNRRILFSLCIILGGYSYIFKLYQFDDPSASNTSASFSIMSYNVRLFNTYHWIDNDNVTAEISNVIKKEDPDIICFQEYQLKSDFQTNGYKRYEYISDKNVKKGLAIFSRFPIINSGIINFKSKLNNAIYIDIVIKNDTLRVYNLHLKSFGIDTKIDALKKETSEHIYEQLTTTFKTQQAQVEKFMAHRSKSPYKSVIVGDFNNTSFSYVYRAIKANHTDAYLEKGQGLGRTFRFKFFPLRIDFILVDPKFLVQRFKTLQYEFSDHYPIIAHLRL